MELTLTPAAEKFVRRMVRFGGAGEHAGFRLTVSAGGCSGLASEFSVEPAPLAGDAVVELNGVRFFLPAESRLLLEGATIDFADTPTSSGLTFVTPNSPACGCGSSSSGIASIDISSIGHRH
jgi:iron-sulfur cluster assembly accessory protein